MKVKTSIHTVSVSETDNGPSILENVDIAAFNTSDRKILKQLADISSQVSRVITSNQKLQPEPASSMVMVHYDPSVFTDDMEDPHNREHIYRTMKTDHDGPLGDGAESWQTAKEWRDKTKHRIVSSPVNCFAVPEGEIFYDTPFEFYLSTACAPNFMSSNKKDEADFLKDGKLADSEQYFKLMTLLFKRILFVQDQAGVEIFVSPLFGGGVYLNKINELDDKRDAQTQIHRALMTALEESKLENIKEVIYTLPDDKKGDHRSDAFEAATEIFDKHYTGTTKLTVANVDMFAALRFAHGAGKKVGLLNAGSDRTIGGAYAKKSTVDRAQKVKKFKGVTVEESIFCLTDAAYRQALNWSQQNIEFVALPKELCLDFRCAEDKAEKGEKRRSLLIESENAPNKKDFKQFASDIKAKFEMGEHPWVSLDSEKQVVKVSFKSQPNAIAFASKIKEELGLESQSSDGKPKFVHSEDKQYSVVWLSYKEYESVKEHVSKSQEIEKVAANVLK